MNGQVLTTLVSHAPLATRNRFHLPRAGLAGVVIAMLAACSYAAQPADRFPAKAWEEKTPDQVGLDPVKLQQFIDTIKAPSDNSRGGPAKESDSHGVVIKDGYLVASWGKPSKRFNWYSASKPALSTILFFAIAEGKLKGVEDKVADWGWQLSDKDKPMTFAHLANMISGYSLKDPPGAAFAYNDLGIRLYVLTLQKVFGKDIISAGNESFSPLQLQDGDLFNEKGRVDASARDFARVGWFWMHRGNWNGKAVLPRELFDKYMKPTVPPELPISTDHQINDYLQIGSYGGPNNQVPYGPGLYGYCWWFNAPLPKVGELNWPSAPPDAFAALGYGGCNMVMIPSKGLVVAARANWGRAVAGGQDSRFNQNLKLLVDAVK